MTAENDDMVNDNNDENNERSKSEIEQFRNGIYACVANETHAGGR